MKKLYALLAMLLLSVAAMAQDGRAIYNKYSDLEDVQAVYISPAMFRLIGKIPDLQVESESVNLAPLIQSLSGFYLISTSRSDIIGELATEVERFVKKGRYELLMEAKDNGEATRMYTVGSEKLVHGFVMLNYDGDEVNFISLDGTIPREQLEALIADAVKD